MAKLHPWHILTLGIGQAAANGKLHGLHREEGESERRDVVLSLHHLLFPLFLKLINLPVTFGDL